MSQSGPDDGPLTLTLCCRKCTEILLLLNFTQIPILPQNSVITLLLPVWRSSRVTRHVAFLIAMGQCTCLCQTTRLFLVVLASLGCDSTQHGDLRTTGDTANEPLDSHCGL